MHAPSPSLPASSPQPLPPFWVRALGTSILKKPPEDWYRPSLPAPREVLIWDNPGRTCGSELRHMEFPRLLRKRLKAGREQTVWLHLAQRENKAKKAENLPFITHPPAEHRDDPAGGPTRVQENTAKSSSEGETVFPQRLGPNSVKTGEVPSFHTCPALG